MGAAAPINPATNSAAFVQGRFIFHEPDLTEVCAAVSQSWNGTCETQTRQQMRMLLGGHQRGCQTSQEDNDDQWLKQTQAPREVPFHHHWFLFPSELRASVSPATNTSAFRPPGGPSACRWHFSVGFSLYNAAASSFWCQRPGISWMMAQLKVTSWYSSCARLSQPWWG